MCLSTCWYILGTYIINDQCDGTILSEYYHRCVGQRLLINLWLGKLSSRHVNHEVWGCNWLTPINLKSLRRWICRYSNLLRFCMSRKSGVRCWIKPDGILHERYRLSEDWTSNLAKQMGLGLIVNTDESDSTKEVFSTRFLYSFFPRILLFSLK